MSTGLEMASDSTSSKSCRTVSRNVFSRTSVESLGACSIDSLFLFSSNPKIDSLVIFPPKKFAAATAYRLGRLGESSGAAADINITRGFTEKFRSVTERLIFGMERYITAKSRKTEQNLATKRHQKAQTNSEKYFVLFCG
jgi:hypothetical protein